MTSEILNFYSDASVSRIHGRMGAVFNDHWISHHYGTCLIDTYKSSIEFLELFALVAGVLTWSESLQHLRITIFCDNQSVRDIIYGDTSRFKVSMKLVRLLILDNLKYNRRVSVKYVKSQDNYLADPLSRGNFQQFWKLALKTMLPNPDKIPAYLFPPEKNPSLNIFANSIVGSPKTQCDKQRRDRRRNDMDSSSSMLSTSAILSIVDRLCTQSCRNLTNKNYYTVWKLFNQFFIRLDSKLDNWEDRIILFAGYLIENGRKSTTVKSSISAIKASTTQ